MAPRITSAGRFSIPSRYVTTADHSPSRAGGCSGTGGRHPPGARALYREQPHLRQQSSRDDRSDRGLRRPQRTNHLPRRCQTGLRTPGALGRWRRASRDPERPVDTHRSAAGTVVTAGFACGAARVREEVRVRGKSQRRQSGHVRRVAVADPARRDGRGDGVLQARRRRCQRIARGRRGGLARRMAPRSVAAALRPRPVPPLADGNLPRGTDVLRAIHRTFSGRPAGARRQG